MIRRSVVLWGGIVFCRGKEERELNKKNSPSILVIIRIIMESVRKSGIASQKLINLGFSGI